MSERKWPPIPSILSCNTKLIIVHGYKTPEAPSPLFCGPCTWIPPIKTWGAELLNKRAFPRLPNLAVRNPTSVGGRVLVLDRVRMPQMFHTRWIKLLCTRVSVLALLGIASKFVASTNVQVAEAIFAGLGLGV